MTVLIHIPHILQNAAGDREQVEVQGKNVGECLQHLIQLYPSLKKDLYKNGTLQNHIEIYVNMESAYPEELKKPVQEGDEIHITLMLSGG